eukprot:1740940-Prorocentrum_lima.AAC.1
MRGPCGPAAQTLASWLRRARRLRGGLHRRLGIRSARAGLRVNDGLQLLLGPFLRGSRFLLLGLLPWR